MKGFEIQTIHGGKVIDTRPLTALFYRSLWQAMGKDVSGYILDLAGERVAVFEAGRTWSKINSFFVHVRSIVMDDGLCWLRTDAKRPFIVMWQDKNPGLYGSFKAMLTAIMGKRHKGEEREKWI